MKNNVYLKKLNGEIVFSGKQLALLDKKIKEKAANQIVKLLKKNKDHMLQFNQKQLIEKYFDEENSVIILDKKDSKLIGFAKNMPWPGKNEDGEKVYEFGSWLVHPKYQGKGYGHHLALMAVKSLKEKDKNSQLISICDCSNKKPIEILKKLGAKNIFKPKNVEILLDEGQAKVTILDLSVINYKF